MSCSQFDVRDYFFGELAEADRAAVERHAGGCDACASELDELRAMRGALMTLREEEPPRRIGFVSDKVFEPSPFRRWLSDFWMSGARLGFASAAMLSAALVVFAVRPQPPAIVQSAPAAAPVNVQAVVDEAVKKALAEQDRNTQRLLAASEERHQTEERAMAVRVSDYLTNIEKRMTMNRSVAMNFGEGQ
jgi:anti-sigma factor RsiW